MSAFVEIFLIASSSDFWQLQTSMKVCLVLCVLSMIYGICFPFRKIFQKENRKNAVILMIAFFPSVCSFLFDFVNKFILGDLLLPFTSVFGWQITIVIFLLLLGYQYGKLHLNAEKANITLEDEVRKKTQRLIEINSQLETERSKTSIELDLASSMQKKILPKPEKSFMGWDVAILYEPLQKVSGDLYDYFDLNGKLNGLSLFDISGHGISASMISVMAKNVIRRNFLRGHALEESPSKILSKISREIAEEKGEVDRFIFGFEESYGYLAGPYVRDKDAVIARTNVKFILQTVDILIRFFTVHLRKRLKKFFLTIWKISSGQLESKILTLLFRL